MYLNNVILYMMHRAHRHYLQRVVRLDTCLSMAFYCLGITLPSGAPVRVSLAALAVATGLEANMYRYRV